jgi:hypothetical protein
MNLKRDQPFEYKRDKYKIIGYKESALMVVSPRYGQLNNVLTRVVCEKINK